MKNPVIFFDGVCNLCNWFVRVLIRFDKKRLLRFSNLQSDYAKSIEIIKPFISEPFESVIFYNGDTISLKSDAVIEIAKLLPVPWNYFGIIRFIPKRLRDLLYVIVARNRYRLFGRKDQCIIQDPEIIELFLD